MARPDHLRKRDILIVPTVGRFIWDPILQTVDFKRVGKQNPTRSKCLDTNQNDRHGALRLATRMLTAWLKEPT